MSERGVSRYEALIATLVGVMALAVSGYTAYIQRQQVRAQVWPYVSFAYSNLPHLVLTVSNRGVGPAIVKDVRMRVDGHPCRDWDAVLTALLGPGPHSMTQSQLESRVLVPGETVNVLEPHDEQGRPIPPGPLSQELRAKLGRLDVEICYCSTLDDCWQLGGGLGEEDDVRPVRRCRARDHDSFVQ